MRYLFFLVSFLFVTCPVFSQLSSDSPIYCSCTLHYPSDLGAKINTIDATYSFFQRVYSNHSEDINLTFVMDTNRSYDGDIDMLFEGTYYQQISGLLEKGIKVPYKTMNLNKKFWVVSWSEGNWNYYVKRYLHSYSFYTWILKWNRTDKDTHALAQSYLNNNRIYFTW